MFAVQLLLALHPGLPKKIDGQTGRESKCDRGLKKDADQGNMFHKDIQ